MSQPDLNPNRDQGSQLAVIPQQCCRASSGKDGEVAADLLRSSTESSGVKTSTQTVRKWNKVLNMKILNHVNVDLEAATTPGVKSCAKFLLYICNYMFSPHTPVITLCLPLISRRRQP